MYNITDMNIKILPYNNIWLQQYQKESSAIEKLLGNILISIYHIGSTAVDGLMARPIIDILILVADINLLDEKEDALEQYAYTGLGEFGVSGRRVYRKGYPDILYQIFAFDIFSNDKVIGYLALRDYLKEHKEICSFYSSLKAALIKEFGENLEAYNAGKDAFLQDLAPKALEWYMRKFAVK